MFSFFSRDAARRRVMAREWTLCLDFESTCAKYVADGSLDKDSYSVPQLELRAILDSPIAVRYLMSHDTDGSCTELVHAWMDTRECSKAVPADQAVILGALFQRYQNNLAGRGVGVRQQSGGLFDDLCQLYRVSVEQIDPNLSPEEQEVVLAQLLEETQRAAQRRSFSELFRCVYEPFRRTPDFQLMRRLISDPDSWVSPNSFEYFDVIAAGGFGLVILCSKKSTGTMYAMKIQPKRRLLRHFRKDKRRVMTEMQAYSLCDHPYVTKLAYATQTASLTMLVMPVAACGDLSRSLAFTVEGRFPMERVQFYAAEIVSALFYLHNFGIIYRDLKPGNILLNADGHVMLADFGSLADMSGVLNPGSQYLNAATGSYSKLRHRSSLNSSGGSGGGVSYSSRNASGSSRSMPEIIAASASAASAVFGASESPSFSTVSTPLQQQAPHASSDNNLSTPQRTKSLVGTVEYMAPEIVVMLGKKMAHKDGYTSAVDWWSLGILIYRLLVGVEPFRRILVDVVDMRLPDLLRHSNCSFEEVFTDMFGAIQYDVPQLQQQPLLSSAAAGATVAATREGGGGGEHDNGNVTVVVDLLRKLLTFDPDKRLGAGLELLATPDVCPIRTHPFFHGVNWKAVDSKGPTWVPPYIPTEEIATSSKVGAADAGRGVNLAMALLQANREDLCDEDDDPCCSYSPQLSVGMGLGLGNGGGGGTGSGGGLVANLFNSLTILVRSRRESSQSPAAGDGREDSHGSVSGSTVPTPTRSHGLVEADQKYFYGWNYVSCELFETPKPFVPATNSLLSFSSVSIVFKKASAGLGSWLGLTNLGSARVGPV